MNENLLRQLKEKLEKEKGEIEEELKKFAKRDIKFPEDWDTKFPKWDGETGFEIEADEVEEYATRLPIEYALELKLKSINLALEKIKRSEYGICEKCKKEIEIERLKANSSARFCLKCKR
ncbi:hypothetical protein AMJ49_00285 [Parcubacteria bacterium DG_74_2]|nr:MAG: hypothetical protein AMJ49_00285 [Parcubacteria bacterium DG_74_2]